MFKFVFVEKVIALLASSDWKMTEELQECVRGAFSGLGVTKATEDAFQRERAGEARGSCSGTVSMMRQWLLPAFKDLRGTCTPGNGPTGASKRSPVARRTNQWRGSSRQR